MHRNPFLPDYVWLEPRERSRPTVLLERLLERVLWLASAIALATVGYNVLAAKLYQQEALAAIDAGIERPIVASALPPGPEIGSTGAGRTAIPEGAPLARLEIPRLGIAVAVAEGDAPAVLRRAVGHLPHSARPGERGNVVLAAHRDTFFRGLGEIREGDVVVLDAPTGRDHYRVTWTEVVEPTAIEVTRPTDHAALTLVTCYPFRWIGLAPQRFVVRAVRHQPAARDQRAASDQRAAIGASVSGSAASENVLSEPVLDGAREPSPR